MGVNPFDSAALGRLIERVVDSGFMVKKNEISLCIKSNKHETSVCININKTGIPFSQNHQTALREKRIPFLNRFKKRMFRFKYKTSIFSSFHLFSFFSSLTLNCLLSLKEIHFLPFILNEF